jgi:hypothetical protein
MSAKRGLRASKSLPARRHGLGEEPTLRAEKRFRQLVKRWKNETEHISSAARMAKHPAYREIIEMGLPAVPLLLGELSREPDFWFAALREITRADPVSPDKAGKVEEMAHAWIEWGRGQGYIK